MKSNTLRKLPFAPSSYITVMQFHSCTRAINSGY